MTQNSNEEQNTASCQTDVSGSLPMYDVDELNEIVRKFNNKEMTLFDFVGRVWNKAYTLGCVDGSK